MNPTNLRIGVVYRCRAITFDFGGSPRVNGAGNGSFEIERDGRKQIIHPIGLNDYVDKAPLYMRVSNWVSDWLLGQELDVAVQTIIDGPQGNILCRVTRLSDGRDLTSDLNAFYATLRAAAGDEGGDAMSDLLALHRAEIVRLERERDAALALAERRAGVLKELEWSNNEYRGYPCPICGRPADEGHAPDCRLAAILDAAPPPDTAAAGEDAGGTR